MKRTPLFTGKTAWFALASQALILASIASPPVAEAASSAARAQSSVAEEVKPYVSSETDYQITESMGADLLHSSEEARETLERALQDSSSLSGGALYERLGQGVRSALAQSEARGELLFFRLVLLRTVELDRIAQSAASAPIRDDLRMISSTVILRAGIAVALHYYQTLDKPRLEQGSLSRDWSKFAGEQIGMLLASADLAPTAAAKREIVKRAVGWTARAINTDPGRRQYKAQFASLKDMLQSLEDGTASAEAAQNLLVTVRLSLPGDHRGNARPGIGAYPTPKAQKPSDGSSGSSLSFPLIGSKDSQLGDGVTFGDVYMRGFLNTEVGAGAGLSRDNRSHRAMTYAEATAAATLVILAFEHSVDSIPVASAGARADFSIGSAGGAGSSPYVHGRAQAWANMWHFIGGWAAIDIDQHPALAEIIFRGGFAPTITAQVGDHSYVLVQYRYGATIQMSGEDLGRASGSDSYNGLTTGFQILLNLSSFSLALSYDHDWGIQRNVPKVGVVHGIDSRDQAEAALSIPLGLIFPNDQIHINGRLVHITDEARGTYHVNQIGGMYEVRF